MALRAKNKLTARKLLAGGFSKDGAQVYGIVRNTTGEGAEWQLYAIDVKTGAEKMLAPLDLPGSTDGVAGFSLHPDGNRFLSPSPSGRTTSGCSKASIRCRGRRGWTVCCGASTPRRAQGLGKTNYRMRRDTFQIHIFIA